MFSLGRHAVVCVSMLHLLAWTGNAKAGEEYFLLMFSSQRIPNDPNYAHTFATFVRTRWQGNGPCPANAAIEAHTISWLPANLKIRVGALQPEPGHNFNLYETLDFAYSCEERVSLWGPYPIENGLYCKALQRKSEIEGGHIRYKANDMGYRSNRVSNCIHAVSTIVEGPKLRVASPGWGESSSYFVLKEMEPWILSKQVVPWIGSALDLDRRPIIYRDFQNPRSNAVFGPVFRVLGSERSIRATYGPPIR